MFTLRLLEASQCVCVCKQGCRADFDPVFLWQSFKDLATLDSVKVQRWCLHGTFGAQIVGRCIVHICPWSLYSVALFRLCGLWPNVWCGLPHRKMHWTEARWGKVIPEVLLIYRQQTSSLNTRTKQSLQSLYNYSEIWFVDQKNKGATKTALISNVLINPKMLISQIWINFQQNVHILQFLTGC